MATGLFHDLMGSFHQLLMAPVRMLFLQCLVRSLTFVQPGRIAWFFAFIAWLGGCFFAVIYFLALRIFDGFDVMVGTVIELQIRQMSFTGIGSNCVPELLLILTS